MVYALQKHDKELWVYFSHEDVSPVQTFYDGNIVDYFGKISPLEVMISSLHDSTEISKDNAHLRLPSKIMRALSGSSQFINSGLNVHLCLIGRLDGAEQLHYSTIEHALQGENYGNHKADH